MTEHTFKFPTAITLTFDDEGVITAVESAEGVLGYYFIEHWELMTREVAYKELFELSVFDTAFGVYAAFTSPKDFTKWRQGRGQDFLMCNFGHFHIFDKLFKSPSVLFRMRDGERIAELDKLDRILYQVELYG